MSEIQLTDLRNSKMDQKSENSAKICRKASRRVINLMIVIEHKLHVC